jgi:protein-tyrosine phosphatase
MKILLVCLGNICRSPAAEAALRAALAGTGLDGAVEVDSAGTGDWHVGEPPDRRMVAAAGRAGLRLEGTARRVTSGDFEHYDLVLAMDADNLRTLRALAPDEEARSRIRLFREFEAGADDLDVPDPYYGGSDGFERVLAIVRASARGVVAYVQEQRAGRG